MKILAFESTCDETSVAIVEDGRKILINKIFSQADLHAIYGGVVPEIASRCHVEAISVLTETACKDSNININEIDAIAVSYAPGLIGAVLVGVNYAKSLAYSLGKPLIPVHHIRGHIAANYLAYPDLTPPFICLSISGGNTLLVDVCDYTIINIIGSSKDDAVGECFDKTARVLGLSYPGGKKIDELAKKGNENCYSFPISKIESNEFDFSFSGLKTAVINLVHNSEQNGKTISSEDLAASFNKAVSESLVPKTIKACKNKGYNKLVIAGGVAANSKIRNDFEIAAKENELELFIPPLSLCGDNAAMIGAQGYYEYLAGSIAGTNLNAYATMDINGKI